MSNVINFSTHRHYDREMDQFFSFMRDDNGRIIGKLYHGASLKTLMASPGIQSWSRPGGGTHPAKN